MPKFKKYCSILNFLEDHEPELHRVVRGLCQTGLLIPRGIDGITFMCPSDKNYKKKIIDSAYSDDSEKAVQMIKALIITDIIDKPNMFMNKEVGNRLGQVIDVETANTKEVKLANGGMLTIDDRFKPTDERKNIAVYKLSGDTEIPLSGKKSSHTDQTDQTNGGFYGGRSKSKKKHHTLSSIIQGGVENAAKTGTLDQLNNAKVAADLAASRLSGSEQAAYAEIQTGGANTMFMLESLNKHNPNKYGGVVRAIEATGGVYISNSGDLSSDLRGGRAHFANSFWSKNGGAKNAKRTHDRAEAGRHAIINGGFSISSVKSQYAKTGGNLWADAYNGTGQRMVDDAMNEFTGGARKAALNDIRALYNADSPNNNAVPVGISGGMGGGAYQISGLVTGVRGGTILGGFPDDPNQETFSGKHTGAFGGGIIGGNGSLNVSKFNYIGGHYESISGGRPIFTKSQMVEMPADGDMQNGGN
jgi:hypothetical protein